MLNKLPFIILFFGLLFLGIRSDFIIAIKAAPYPLLWNVPLRNEHYVQRGDILKKIDAQLRGEGKVITFVGITGIGKTQLVKEYAHISYKKYDIIWWLDASKDLDSQFKEFSLAWNTKIKNEPILTENLSNKALVNHVKDKLRITQKKWLLIFDNASHKDNVKDYFPETQGKNFAHILITSKDQTTWSHAFPVTKLARAESIELIQKIVGERAKEESTNDLAELLGDFPLALSQAAAYLKSCPSLTVQGYIKLFKAAHKRVWEDETKLIAQHGESLMEYKETTSTALKLAIDEILKESQEAYDLLLFVSFLAPNQIPYPLLKKFFEINKTYGLPDQVISVLEKRLFLVRDDTKQSKEFSYGIHEMIQFVVRDNLDKKQKHTFLTKASKPFLILLDDRRDQREKISWESAFQHVKMVISFAQEELCHSIELLKLRTLFLNYILGDKRELQDGKKQLEAIESSLQATPLNDPFYEALYHINKGNFLIWGNADYSPALNHQRKAFKLLEGVKQDADQKLRALTQMAQYSLLEGDTKSAKLYLDQGQALDEKAQDIIMRALYHYGKAFYFLFTTDYEDGLKEIEFALDLLKKGPPCPSINFSTGVLKAELLLKMGNLQDAYKQAHEIFKKARYYHQDINNMFCAKAMMIMAASLSQSHKHTHKASELLKSADAIFEILSKDAKGKHRRQAWSNILLGDVHASKKEWKEAYENYKQAENIYNAIYKGKELGDYSELYTKLTLLGIKMKDEELTHKYLKAHINTFGLDHPQTMELLKHLDDQNLSVL